MRANTYLVLSENYNIFSIFSSTYQANLNVQVLMHTSTDTQMLIVVDPIFALDSLRYLSISIRQDSCLSSITMTFEGKFQLIFDTTLNLEARILVDHLTCWGKELKTEQVQYSLLAPSTFESERTQFCKPT